MNIPDVAIRTAALNFWLAAIEKQAEKDAFDVKCAHLLLANGETPESMGHDPSLPDIMTGLLREEARIRQRLASA